MKQKDNFEVLYFTSISSFLYFILPNYFLYLINVVTLQIQIISLFKGYSFRLLPVRKCCGLDIVTEDAASEPK